MKFVAYTTRARRQRESASVELRTATVVIATLQNRFGDDDPEDRRNQQEGEKAKHSQMLERSARRGLTGCSTRYERELLDRSRTVTVDVHRRVIRAPEGKVSTPSHQNSMAHTSDQNLDKNSLAANLQ